ncbi:golvesin C-terminal-like domain-containing protein [Streptomyces sp. 7N604]|uniref:golvesin C-terminal-like domain-containing protein n=1 Tax=Streptomyces sp. 7N604 TaxID=3457415 RepID=UPI003FD22F06
MIGNFYGVDYTPDGDQADPWKIDWTKADCGYGITQVTDGMRLDEQGHKLTKTQQEAIALDYTANIAAGVNILIEKWNETRKAGLKVNDGHPKFIENWFFALWAYNSGFYKRGDDPDGGTDHWGVGFTNNPANPIWKANRTPFLENADGKDDYSHASHPQDWPYEEKVIGWAARPIAAMFKPGIIQPGYRAAWWNDEEDRTAAKPPIDLFCDASNYCDPGRIGENDSNDPGQGACTLDESEVVSHWLHCWWNKPVQWKLCVEWAQCGNPVHRFDDTYPEQPDENSYPPRCGKTGLPDGALIIDNLPDGITPAGSAARSCGVSRSDGAFKFQFTNSNGTYPGKMDFHQIGAGQGNHFWFSHTRNKNAGHPTDSTGARLFTTGTWTLNQSNIGRARAMVHIPDHGAHTRQATYNIGGSDSTSDVRVVPQRTRANRWVSLGAFRFTGTPSVSLSTHTTDGTGDEDVAWDAVAFPKLPGKPKHQIVAMGDSYSSGEGVSEGNDNYYPETNYRDAQNDSTRNACHRSTKAWSRQATLPGYTTSIGEMEDSHSPSMDYHLIACSGARTYNILKYPENGELPQIQKGYLDQHTSLVTLSIGGNDSRFSYIIQKCLLAFTRASCQGETFDDHDPKIDRDVDGDGQVETGRDQKGFENLTLDKAAPKLISEVVKPDIVNVLKQVHRKAPNAKIVLMGYPKLVSDNASCLNLGPIGLSADSNAWLDSIAEYLAAEMQAAVNTAKSSGIDARFSNPIQNFTGKGICGDPETVHGLVKTLVDSDHPASDWPMLREYGLSAQSFHPKIAGARLYADALEGTMSGWVQ